MKNIVIVLLFFAHLAVIPSCKSRGVMEKEPNNSFSTAGAVTVDASHLGYMGGPGDRDFYIYSSEGRGAIDIQVSGVKGINLAFKIWRGEEEPRLLKYVDDNRKSSPERLANLSVAPGTYYIEILQSDRDAKKPNREIPYELTLKMRDAVSEESEPNDSRDDADTLSADGGITGYYSPAYNRLNEEGDTLHREEDWFVLDISLKQDETRLLDLSLSGVIGINSVMALYDSGGNLLAETDNGGPDEPESISGAGIKKSGSYYVLVWSKGYTASHEEPYRLAATLREHDAGVEIEPNGDPERCNVIQNNIITGRINTKDDIDMFLYEGMDGPSFFRIELKPPEDMDVMLAIQGNDREKITECNSGGRGKKEVYPNYFAAGSFYITITAKTGEKLPDGEYVLTVAPLGDREGHEREPNNEIAQAGQIKGASVTGYTSSRGDKDYFRISHDVRVKERFEIRGPKGGAIRVSITDPLGYIIKTIDAVGDRAMTFSEMIDKKGYIIVESIKEDYDAPYIIYFRGAQ